MHNLAIRRFGWYPHARMHLSWSSWGSSWFWASRSHHVGIPWASERHLMGISWACRGHLMGISCAHGHLMGIQCALSSPENTTRSAINGHASFMGLPLAIDATDGGNVVLFGVASPQVASSRVLFPPDEVKSLAFLILCSPSRSPSGSSP